MSDKELLQQVDSEYLSAIKNLDGVNPRLLIMFSGPPGSGKTTIAKAIEEEFGAIRLASDDVRRIIHARYPNMELSEINRLVLIYMNEVLPKVEAMTRNGLWIADASVDRNYLPVKDFADRYGFKTLVLAIQISDDEHEKRIHERGAHPFASLQKIVSLAEQRRNEQIMFLAHHKPDFIVTASTANEEVFANIRKRLSV